MATQETFLNLHWNRCKHDALYSILTVPESPHFAQLGQHMSGIDNHIAHVASQNVLQKIQTRRNSWFYKRFCAIMLIARKGEFQTHILNSSNEHARKSISQFILDVLPHLIDKVITGHITVDNFLCSVSTEYLSI